MNLNEIRTNIYDFLSDFDAYNSPNLPNVKGFFDNTKTTVAIVNGELAEELNYIKLTIQILLSNEKQYEGDTNLYKSVGDLVGKLYKHRFIYSKPVNDINFEFSLPDSGVWRCLLSFTITTLIDTGEIDGTIPTVDSIGYEYV